jgi:hypothetical protein
MGMEIYQSGHEDQGSPSLDSLVHRKPGFRQQGALREYIPDDTLFDPDRPGHIHGFINQTEVPQ